MSAAPVREGSKGRILLVDDTPSTLLVLVALLTERGYVVHPAEEGALALRFMESVLPDLILLDIRMPAMDGYQVCSRLKEDTRTRDIPVIFLSSVDQVIDKVKAFRCGAVDYISKPFEAEEVLARIETQLSLRRLRAGLEVAVRERTAELVQTNARLQEEIAERIQAEKALRASERRFAMAFQASPIPLSITTLEESRFLVVNDEFAHATGYTTGELASHTAAELGLWSDAESFEKVAAQLRKQGRVHNAEGALVTKQGESRAMLFSMEIIDLDGRECVLFAAFDITDRKLAERQLRKSAEEIRKLYNDAPCGYHSLDASGLFLQMNDTELNWLGYAREEVVQRMNIADLLTPESRETFHSSFTRLKEFRRLQGLELEMVRKDGSVMPVLLNLTAPGRGSGDTAVNANLFDITERKKLEQQFREAQKMEAVGRLAGGVAHDFNNLLTVILGYDQLALSELAPSDPLCMPIDEIRKAAESAASLTRQLLAFSRKQILQPKVLDLNAIVENLQGMLLRLIGEDIQLQALLHPEPVRIKADPGQIEQVILNLVVNARDAMPAGGSLSIETANADLDEYAADGYLPIAAGEYVVLSVNDTGEGIDPEAKLHLFEPFFTTKPMGKGTGLGLSTVYGIVRQSGGSIQVYSEKGRGTTFKVYLPRVQEEPELPKPGAMLEQTRGAGTILLVEDEEMVRNLAARILRRAGYTVLDAAGGMEALVHCERHREVISLMITDVVMQDVRGPELAKTLGSLCPQMKVLYISGYLDDMIAPEGLLDQNTAFLQKPFTPATLLQKVSETLLGS
jgi:two-component system cell cycle sensor histidine kinase/response regulator CckA